MRNKSFNKDHLKFLLAGLLFVVLLDKFVWGNTPPHIEQARQEVGRQTAMPEPETGQEAGLQDKDMVLAKFTPEIKIPEEIPELKKQYGPPEPPAWRKNAAAAHYEPGQPRITIVIDDLGVSRNYTKEVLELPGPLTLAFLPYAGGLAPLVERGRENGHEIMVHMPMEPIDQSQDMGGIFLDTEQTPEEFDAMLKKGLGALEGYVGINNHMGSRLTQDRAAMEKVMAELRDRGLLFLDSRTIAASVAADTAADFHIPYAVRNVFLDNDEALESIRERLQETERIALRTGHAIAIGHPRRHTIDALKEWLPTLKEKGIALVPVSAAVTTPSAVSTAHYGPPAPQRQ